MTNIVEFPNRDEVFTEEELADFDYERGHDLGAKLRAKYIEEADLITAGMNDAEIDGFWEGFYG